jgi:hypothetical protein
LAIFFILPVTEFLIPVRTTILPQMEINIEMPGGDTLEGSQKKAHYLGSNQESEVAGFNTSKMKPP